MCIKGRATPWVRVYMESRAVSAKALIVRFFCSFRAKFDDVPFSRALPWAICSIAFQAANKPLFVRTSLNVCKQRKFGMF